ncbi:centromere protein T [Carcharodon carcharias]|uniref:centromere protein T n=1 Tax=Carcharodon carcharias TaxID=13397 RepID=UPI001B7F1D8F|nr:centromere protein T [Carcharodon carcharias]
MEGDERMEGDEVSDERMEGDEVSVERMEGDEVSVERMEGDEVSDEEEHDEVAKREELMENSESEDDDDKVKPTFQQSDKVFRSSPLLTTPHFLKILSSKAQKPLVKVKQNPKKPTQTRKKTILPGSFVKSVFTHYAKMRVKKETFTVVEQCLELYFKQLCDDVDVYSKHAKRRTIEKEDLELLMKRQGFVTAKSPLNVLIEHHLPMECREKLIPMAVSGSKIIPKK